MSSARRKAIRIGVTARILAGALAAVLAVLQLPALANCVGSADPAGSSALHDPCHDASADPDEQGCAHEIGPDPISTPDALASIEAASGASAPAPTYRSIPRPPSADAPSRRPPPLAAVPVPLFLLHLHLLN